MILDRSCGILLHVTSLPGNHGIGTLGREAREFAELLKDAGQTYWQILPLGPVSPAFDFSPYATTSAFAGNPYFVSLDEIAKEKWHGGRIDAGDFDEDHFVDFDRVTGHKMRELERANDLFFSAALPEDMKAYGDFCTDAAWWLDDFSLYTALAEHFSTNNWTEWDGDISAREPAALKKWSARLEERVRYHRFVQFIFFRQWKALKKHCNDLGIKIIGDIPIYINLEGADAWASPSILQLDEKTLMPQAVAGVPPDYFSETGQRWGNPIYRWEDDKGRLNEETYAWWRKRLEHLGGSPTSSASTTSGPSRLTGPSRRGKRPR